MHAGAGGPTVGGGGHKDALEVRTIFCASVTTGIAAFRF